MSMADFFEQAIQAAQRGEEQSRANDIQAFKTLMDKPVWDDADLDATTDLWCRAGMDPLLNEQMEASTTSKATISTIVSASDASGFTRSQ